MPGSDLRLLALDGGGVRGLFALMILERLMEAVNLDAPPKPCDYFDMIGRDEHRRANRSDCIAAYLSLSDRVFRKTRHRVTVKGKVQGRFDAEELARAIKEVVKQQGLPEDALLKDVPEAQCKVFVCATSKETSEMVCLTSYKTSRGGSDLLNSVTIWEACRATSAATSFFDPIAVGRFGEQFVYEATGANNPVREMWDQAQLVWGPEPLEGKVKCLVSIGTGVPSLKPFKDDVFNIGKTLAVIATETEQTAEQFRRERGLLDSTGRYYRFNVDRGLEDIGLEVAKKVKEMAAATRQYISSHEVRTQMQACAGSIAGREYFGEYKTNFSLEGVPRARQYVDRPAEMAELERVLLMRPAQGQRQRQKIHVLRGLGGMGKTQLAVEFARRHHRRFSSVFWLDGRSKDILKRSIASYAGRIPQGQIPKTSRGYAADASADIDAIVKDVMAWLGRPDNTAWLLIFDNVDREYTAQGGDPDAYDVRRYLSGADHGLVLVTTRLARVEQLGESQQLGKVSTEQSQAILESWYKRKHDTAESERLLALLDGLPLAIAQAGAYLQESGVGLAKYLGFYEQQWSELMQPDDLADAPLQDYPERSVWTTWAISYQAIRDRHQHTANLLLLWSFLDNKDLWHGLLAAGCRRSAVAARMLSEWVGNIASSDLKFSRAMQLLCNYSLAEHVQEMGSYATHPVVHQWAHHSQGKRFATELSRLAVVAVGLAVPESSTRDYAALQRRLLLHGQACSRQIAKSEAIWGGGAEGGSDGDVDEDGERKTVLDAVHLLGDLYTDQGKLGEAKQMYDRALRGYEEALGVDHTSTLKMVNNLGNLYAAQGKLGEAEQMYDRALRGKEEAFGLNHTSTLQTVNNLGSLYAAQGKLGEAKQMYKRALRGKEEALGLNHTSTLQTVNNLGSLYAAQGKLGEAEQMYERALRGYEEALGVDHTSTLQTVNNLGSLYAAQGKLGEAEQMYDRALRGYEEALGVDHTSTLQTVNNLGNLYAAQGKLGEAKQMYERALRGYEETLGLNHTSTLDTMGSLGNLYIDQGKLGEAEQMYERALRGKEEALGLNHTSTLQTVNNLGSLYAAQGKLGEAKQMYERALRGKEEALGLNHTSTLDTMGSLGNLYIDQGKLGEAEQMYDRALRGYEALDSVRVQQYLPALNTLENIGDLYAKQAEVAKARAMYTEALSGLTNVLDQSSERCMRLAAKISGLPLPNQEKEAQLKLSTMGKGLHHGATKRKRA
ncbi:Tetratricopeptide repeat [Pyrenophora tritici-repentis]|nr:Tetratricopeptide repeat [Pyrenophora tritici-repentis]